jgi:beta-glucanase (GH16 family)
MYDAGMTTAPPSGRAPTRPRAAVRRPARATVALAAVLLVTVTLLAGGREPRASAGAIPSPCVLKGAPGPPSGPPRGPWTLQFSDDFSGTTLDNSKWEPCYPWATSAGCTNFGNRNHELQWYLPSQDQVSGGQLHLVALREATQGQTKTGAPEVYGWRSGIVTTFSHFAFKYGYVQVVAKIPVGPGSWSGLWLAPVTNSWPPEIDMEESRGERPGQVLTIAHLSGTGPLSGTGRWCTGLQENVFHTFGIDWEPGSITWYIDGKARYQVLNNPSHLVPDQPMYFLANLAIAGTTLGPVTASSPKTASFDIDQVRVWQK